MAKNCLALAAAIILGLIALTAPGEEASVALGKKLFNDPTLGGSTSPASCNGCHPDGKGLEKAAGKDSLVTTINFCIEQPLQGKPLDKKSVELESLRMYINTLAK